MANRSNILDDVQEKVKSTKPEKIIDKINSLESDLRDSQKQVDELNLKINQSKASELFNNVKQAGDLTVIAQKVNAKGMNDLRELADNWKSSNKSDVLILATESNGKANMIVSLGKKSLG